MKENKFKVSEIMTVTTCIYNFLNTISSEQKVSLKEINTDVLRQINKFFNHDKNNSILDLNTLELSKVVQHAASFCIALDFIYLEKDSNNDIDTHELTNEHIESFIYIRTYTKIFS